MKTSLLLFNAVSVVVLLLWLGYHYLKALGNAFGNVNPATGPGDVTLLFVGVALATVACGVSSFFAPANAARIVALIPVAFVLLGQGFIAYRQGANRERHERAQDAQRAVRESRLRRISQDYILDTASLNPPAEFKQSFLTHDRDLHTIVRIDVGHRAEISAYGIGKIDGDHLDTAESGASFEKFYGRYLDPEGKSIFDRYTIRHRPDQDWKSYQLEKYAPR